MFQKLTNKSIADIIEEYAKEEDYKLDFEGRAKIKITDTFTVRCPASKTSIMAVAKKYRKGIRKININAPSSRPTTYDKLFADMIIEKEYENAFRLAYLKGRKVNFNVLNKDELPSPILYEMPVKEKSGFISGRVIIEGKMKGWYTYHIDTGRSCGAASYGYASRKKAVEALLAIENSRIEKGIEIYEGGYQQRARAMWSVRISSQLISAEGKSR